MPTETSNWNNERVALLKQLWADGVSGTQIGIRLGGISRNAVIGKVHRLGLSGRSVIARKTKPSPKVCRAMRASLRWGKPVSRVPVPVEPLPPPHVTDIARMSFIDLDETKHCKFIVGEPKGPYEKQFCGDQKVPGLPYCLAHSHRCFYVPERRTTVPRFSGTTAAYDQTRALDELLEAN